MRYSFSNVVGEEPEEEWRFNPSYSPALHNGTQIVPPPSPKIVVHITPGLFHPKQDWRSNLFDLRNTKFEISVTPPDYTTLGVGWLMLRSGGYLFKIG